MIVADTAATATHRRSECAAMATDNNSASSPTNRNSCDMRQKLRNKKSTCAPALQRTLQCDDVSARQRIPKGVTDAGGVNLHRSKSGYFNAEVVEVATCTNLRLSCIMYKWRPRMLPFGSSTSSGSRLDCAPRVAVPKIHSPTSTSACHTSTPSCLQVRSYEGTHILADPLA